MRAERPWRGGLGLVLAVALLNAGCASLPAKSGHGATLAFRPFSSASTQAVRSAAEGAYPGEVLVSTAEGAEEPLGLRREPLVGESEGAGASGAKAVASGGAVVCGGRPVLSGWPHLDSSREVLEPFLACASPAQFVAMQRGVDMAALVESLEDWDAVRLGALGPMDARASEALGRKRAAFLVTSVEKYGVPYSEVLALFVLHSAFDDELREVVQRLARDKQLRETLGAMATVREELKRRGLALEGFPERGEQARDVLRGLGRAGRDILSSSAASDGARGQSLWAKRTELPLPYQAALDEVQKALTERHYSPGSTSAGAFDHLTFGVPVGFYHLTVGTGHGAYSLAQGKYEQATRELAPAALMVALYAGGKGARALAESMSGGRAGLRRLSAPDVGALKAVVKELEEQFGPDAVREVFSLIRGKREVALFAVVEGPAGVVALHEARGNLPKAQATLAERYREPSRASATGGGVGKRSGGRPSLPPDVAGIPAEVAEAKLRQAEAEAGGARLPMDVGFLKKHREALLKAAPPGAEVHSLWPDYLSYLERRAAEIVQHKASKGPLEWAGYQVMRDRYARGLAFERKMVALMEEDAARPRAQRRWLKDFDQPRIETHVGVAKADLRFADVLAIEEGPAAGPTPRVETFSLKSRDLSLMKEKPLQSQLIDDAGEALRYYGETLSIRRPGLVQKAQVQRVRVIYEGGRLLPQDLDALERSVRKAESDVAGVEVQFQ
ncbi:hypothetical protein D7V97_35580 [Corallococcus sp. CA053C]|uniref:hypothetical protein n=1 Tax=Corallococcus sp. CA053C TaxID=2316732 RepID=UPI000EA05DDC|nr:hypothetical protein [Corallococcus sp. CA053C]RKG96457.1 hypothetical protein D7V97_35580 [Corallococcus sp. CA053C]